MYKDEHQYYKFIKDNLIDNKIREVFYEELNYYDGENYRDLSNDTHSIDMNVILVLENGKMLQIKWDNIFGCYGIGIEELQKMEVRENIRTFNVTQDLNWQSYIGKKIENIKVLWYNQVPQTWKIQIEDNMGIWISALEINESNKHHYMADHLTVFFNEMKVREYLVDKLEKMEKLD